jgi:predicted metal-dependent RNase
LGRSVQRGLAETPIIGSEGKLELLKVKLRVESIEGFSGHSDRRQIINYVRRAAVKPERIIVNHGEKAKSFNVADYFRRSYKTEVLVPNLLETIKLR